MNKQFFVYGACLTCVMFSQLPGAPSDTMSAKYSLVGYNSSRKHISISIPSSTEVMSPHIKSVEELKVLGINLSSFSAPMQFFICVAGVFIFYLIYGYLQVMTKKKQLSINTEMFIYPPVCMLSEVDLKYAVTCFVGIDIFGGRIQAIRVVPHSGPVWILFHFWPCGTSTHAGQTQEVSVCIAMSHPSQSSFTHSLHQLQLNIQIHVIGLLSRIPGKTYMIIAFLTVGTMGLSNTSLGYLNYPTQVIFKCCKLIPVMIGGMFIQGE